jgi:ectoine hydroxylase-related dioxygenase (phytanoyl-CoA dioxygenase family)
MIEAELELPDLSDDYPLTDAQIAAFHRDGHIYLPQLCSASEVAAYRQVIHESAMGSFKETRPLDERDAYGKAFLQTLNLRLKSAGVRKFVLAKRFASVAARLTGAEAVRIYHEQALFKEPGGALSPWHQDQYYWPLATDQAMGMWMPLVDVTPEMGSILYASGSHREGFVGQYAISDESQQVLEDLVAERGYPIWQQGMKAGDATFHLGWTIHGASANKSDTMREAMIVTYYPDGTRVDALSNPSRVGDAKDFLGGRRPGELADSALNTRVYPD